nr:transposase [Alienimonas californiensis]
MTKRRKRHTPEEIVRSLRDAYAMLNAGRDLAAVLQALEVTEATYHRWRNQYGGMKATEAKKLRELEVENARLKNCWPRPSWTRRRSRNSPRETGGPSRKRDAARHLAKTFAVSQRRACRVVDQHRSTQRYEPTPRSDEGPLLKRMSELVRRRPRYGYRRIGALLRAEGFRLNAKRTFRLWRREGFKAPRKQEKKRRTGDSANACHRRRASGKNDVWAWDFAFDRTTGGSTLKRLSVVDEFTRECLALEVARSVTAEDLIETLAAPFRHRGGGRRTISAATTARSSRRRRSGTGPSGCRSARCTSLRPRRGRTATRRVFTRNCGTSSWPPRSSAACGRLEL